MSQETVELARQVMDALSRRDLPTLIERADPEVEWHPFFAQPGQGQRYRDRDSGGLDAQVP